MTKVPTNPELASPERWLDEHGDALYSYAYLRLRDRDAAEDLVQETLLGALRTQQGFAGQSSERTWLIGILKHKLIDYWRRLARQPAETPVGDDTDDDLLERVFDARDRDHWRTDPSPWRDPDAALQQQQFWQVLTDCIAALPAAQARAFSLCEIEGTDGGEACKVLGVASTNLWVMLHRARLRLRQCLENHWFEREPTR
ncbi:MAG: sigma-70 family RNA polymerase sigma factor [Gammaproteobacteria bacterium]|nr:sigma-70 family RNA polymerase sigma factor [Gammaproteobacteria bacterium]